MKRTIFVSLCLTATLLLNAQNKHGLKLGLNFATLRGDFSSYSEVSSRIRPTFTYTFRTMGEHWGYFLEMGYAQAGCKEVYSEIYQDEYGQWKKAYDEYNLVIHNFDIIPVGVQFAFLSDWSKVRPVIQTSLTTRFSLYYKLSSLTNEEDGMPDLPIDILWSIGGGAMVTRHATFTLSYGWGFLNVIRSSTGLKSNQFQISAYYFF
jgi:hypothetical protein